LPITVLKPLKVDSLETHTTLFFEQVFTILLNSKLEVIRRVFGGLEQITQSKSRRDLTEELLSFVRVFSATVRRTGASTSDAVLDGVKNVKELLKASLKSAGSSVVKEDEERFL